MNIKEICENRPLQFILRVCQIVFAVVAMACIANVKLSTNSIQFLFLISFAAWVVIFGMLLVANLKDNGVPPNSVMLAIDGVFAILLFAAALSVAVSNTFQDCDKDGTAVNCNTLKSAISFGFISMAFFLATFVMGAVNVGLGGNNDTDIHGYGQSQTPTQPSSSTSSDPETVGDKTGKAMKKSAVGGTAGTEKPIITPADSV